MIISYGNQFIFVKTRKTAGTSVEIALSAVCGDLDIITPISDNDERYRAQSGGKAPQNFMWNNAYGIKYVARDMFCNYKEYIKKSGITGHTSSLKLRWYNHMPASRIMDIVGHKTWNQFFTFAIERNPWERVISRYHWDYARNLTGNMDVDQYIKYLASSRPGLLSNWHLYAKGNEILVNRVIKYENLKGELAEIGRDVLGVDISLPEYRAKGNYRGNEKSSADRLSKDSKDVIANLCRNEIERFGYYCA